MPNNPALPSRPTPKPLQKCVDVQHIRDWVPEAARRRVDLTKAWRIIRDQFCAAVVGRGVCPIVCERCREEIIDLFRLERAGNPEALLTWLAKDHSARWIENLIAAEKARERGSFDPVFPAQETQTPQDVYDALFPKREPVNIFLALLKDYDDENQ